MSTGFDELLMVVVNHYLEKRNEDYNEQGCGDE